MALRLKSPGPVLQPFSLSVPASPATSTSATDDAASSPQTSLLPAEHMHVFGLQPLEPDIGTVACPNCHKPILQSAILEHSGLYY
jgi:hypothetical protein